MLAGTVTATVMLAWEADVRVTVALGVKAHFAPEIIEGKLQLSVAVSLKAPWAMSWT